MPQDLLIQTKSPVQLGECLFGPFQKCKDVITLGLLGYGIGQIPGTPSILLENFSSVSQNDRVKLVDFPFYGIIVQGRI